MVTRQRRLERGASHVERHARAQFVTLDGGGSGPSRREPGQRRLPAAVYAELGRLSDKLAEKKNWQPFVVVGRDGRVLAANRPLLELLGRGEAELLGSSWDAVMPSWREVVGRSSGNQHVVRLYPRRFNTPLYISSGSGRTSVVDAATIVHPVSFDSREPVAFTFLLSPL
jgi:PAS domain-containing protein